MTNNEVINCMVGSPKGAAMINSSSTGEIIFSDLSGHPGSERRHHPFSPSKLASIEICPSFESRNVTHEKAIRGTMQHNAVERCADDLQLSDDEAAAAAECLDFVARRKQLMEEARSRFVFEEASALLTSAPGLTMEECLGRAEMHTPRVQELTEVQLKVDDIPSDCFIYDGKKHEMQPDKLDCTTSGFVDKILIDHTGTKVEVDDWKFGQWAVEKASTNIQGICYVLGAFRHVPTAEQVDLFFKQPALNVLSHATFTRADIPRLYARIRTVVERKIEANRRNDFADAKVTYPTCMFCARLGECPKAAALNLEVSRKFYPVSVPENITPSVMLNTRDTSMCLKVAALAKTWAEAFRSRVTDRVLCMRADVPEGYTLQTRSDREITDPAKFKEVCLRHLTTKELESTISYTLGSVEKIVSDKAPRGVKKEAVENLKTELFSAGAVVKGEPYTFLKAVPSAEKSAE